MPVASVKVPPMTEILLSIAALATVGVGVGFLAGLLGIGGGIVLVPTLAAYSHYFYGDRITDDVLMHTVLGTSLAIIIPTGLSSARAQIKRKAVDWDAIKRLIPGLLVGVTIGVIVAAKLDGAALQIIFALGMYGIAALIARTPAPHQVYPKLLSWPVVLPMSGSVGVLATLLGLGGSIINIPYMTYAGLPLHRAIATGSVLGVLVSAPAAFGFMLTGMQVEGLPPEMLGFINMKAWICIVPFSMLIAPLGVKVSHKMDVKNLRRFFAVFVLIVATKMLWNVVSGYL